MRGRKRRTKVRKLWSWDSPPAVAGCCGTCCHFAGVVVYGVGNCALSAETACSATSVPCEEWDDAPIQLGGAA